MPKQSIKDFISLIDGLPSVLTKVNQDMSVADKRVAEVYHQIEETPITTSVAIVLMTELKNVLKERRKIKERHSIARTIANRKDDYEKIKVLANDLLKLMEV